MPAAELTETRRSQDLGAEPAAPAAFHQAALWLRHALADAARAWALAAGVSPDLLNAQVPQRGGPPAAGS